MNPQGSFLRGYKTFSAFALVKDNPVAAVNQVMFEVLRAQQFGFTQTELDRIKKDLIKKYDEALSEKNKTESNRYAAEYIEHFLTGEPSAGIVAEHRVATEFIQNLTLEKVNEKIKHVDFTKPSFVLFNATEAMKNTTNEQELLNGFQKAKHQKVEAYSEKKSADELMERMPTPGKILKIETNENYGTKILKLSNGITVIYKKTDFKNDEVIFRLSQWGGSTNLTEDEIKTSKYISIVNSLGLGKNKAIDMPKVLSGIEANVFINVTPFQLGGIGNASAKDFEKLLQILHLKVTNINFDAEEYEGIKANFGSQIGGLLKNPMFKFNDTLNQYKFKYNKRLSGFPLASEINSLPLQKLKGLYTKLTANLNGSVILFVGNMEESTFNNLIEKYIASIPTESTQITLNKENIIQPITGKNSFTFKLGKENKSEINHSYYGSVKSISENELLAFTLAAEILQIKATEKLREEMGSTYSPKVNSFVVRPPVGTYSLSLTVSSLPENSDKVISAFDGLVTNMINGTLADDDLAKAKAQRIKVFETQVKTNQYWANLIEQQYMFGFESRKPSEYASRVEAITKADVISVAKKYLSQPNILKGVMNPE